MANVRHEAHDYYDIFLISALSTSDREKGKEEKTCFNTLRYDLNYTMKISRPGFWCTR